MPPESRFVFKEWAVVCAALACGGQTLILRKGGIHEGREGFRVEHREFWLFPTGFHQQREEITADAWPMLDELQLRDKTRGHRLQLLAVVEEVQQVLDRSALSRLAGRHIWSESTVEQRFHYRTPGLFALTVRVYRRPTPFEIGDAPYFAGCKSWVELPAALSTTGLQPVLDDSTFDRQRREIQQLLAGGADDYLMAPKIHAPFSSLPRP
ncbi:MAG: DUF1802 family protein [Planctomycetes bacterium]|nr:DUF1802 family protein [Planctomycetota bacterium]